MGGMAVECVSFKCWDLQVGAIEVGVLGLNSGKGWRWSVYGSDAGAIKVGAIEVGVLGLNSGTGWRWSVGVVQTLEL